MYLLISVLVTTDFFLLSFPLHIIYMEMENHFAYSFNFIILFLFFSPLHFILYMKLEILFFLLFLLYHVISFFSFSSSFIYHMKLENYFTYSVDITSTTTTFYKNKHILHTTLYSLVTLSDKRQMSCVLLFQL